MNPKLIFFDHNGQNLHAEAIYNFNYFSDIMVIIPNIDAKDLNENILLKRTGKKWTTSALKEKFPSTIQNIINSVNKELEKNRSDIFSLEEN